MNITLVCTNIYTLRFGIMLLFGSDVIAVREDCNTRYNWRKTGRMIRGLNSMISEENLKELSYLVQSKEVTTIDFKYMEGEFPRL